MVQPVDGQPAYVLHRRAYRETSALVELLTRDFGVVGAVVRGVKRPSRSARNIEPFGLLKVCWRGRGQLATLTTIEPGTGSRRRLVGDALFAGLYVNELVVKTLAREVPAARLFHDYEAVIDSLAQWRAARVDAPGPGHAGNGTRALEPILRAFERHLLDELGYGIAFDVDISNGRPIEPGRLYRVIDGEGFREVEAAQDSSAQGLFDGAQIADMRLGEYRDPAVLRGAKHVLRRAIALRLGGRTLASRRLFCRRAAGSAPAQADTARWAN